MADGVNATVVSPDYTLTLDPGYKYPMELEEVYAGLLYVYEHAEELNVDVHLIGFKLQSLRAKGLDLPNVPETRSDFLKSWQKIQY